MTQQSTEEVAHYAATFSELMLASAAVGKGVRYDLQDWESPGMVFTAAIHPDAFTAFKRAEADFKLLVDHRRHSDEQDLKLLESQMKASAAVGSRANPEVLQRIEDLKERLSALTHLTWREHDAHKSTMVEAMKRSKFRALTFVDEFGSRVAAGLCNPARMAVEASWMSLTDVNAGDIAFVRSSTTGGATIHSLVGSDKTVFQYLSASSVEVVERLAQRVSKKLHMAAMKGRTITVPVRYGRSPALKLTAAELARVMKEIATRGEKEEAARLPVVMESEELTVRWRELLSVNFESLTRRELTEEAWKAIERMPASFKTLTAFVTKAAFTKAVLDAPSGAERAVVTSEHLQLAWGMLKALLQLAKTFDYLSTRSDNAAKAREARRPSDAVLADVGRRIHEAITASERGMISRKAALQLPVVTAAVLDHLVACGRFKELQGRSNIRMGTTERAYTLAVAGTDPEEAMAELQAAQRALAAGEQADVCQVAEALRQLRAKAAENSRISSVGLPIVKLCEMTPAQIQAVPTLCERFPEEVRLRNTPEAPEPEHLFEYEHGEEGLEAGIPNLWFRYDPDGKPFRDWKLASKLQLTEWAEKE